MVKDKIYKHDNDNSIHKKVMDRLTKSWTKIYYKKIAILAMKLIGKYIIL